MSISKNDVIRAFNATFPGGVQNAALNTLLSYIDQGGAFTPQAAPDDLTDSTTGTPAATLIVVRSDTGAHTAADCEANFASLNALVKGLSDALKAAGVLT